MRVVRGDSRNEVSPSKGIDTLEVVSLTVSIKGRNEGSPREGNNTQKLKNRYGP